MVSHFKRLGHGSKWDFVFKQQSCQFGNGGKVAYFNIS